jgi:enterochelin esterase-like enzyme/thiol-disulfide isomerase/thioredoxin
MYRSFLGLAALLVFAGIAAAEDKKAPSGDEKKTSPPSAKGSLGVGDAAPKLTVKEFLKGKSVRQFERGKVYVVEFWATWCPPCRDTIPHLTKLQKKYPDVTILGVSVSEPDPDKVKPFVEEMGEKMDYRVATDLKGAMLKGWLQAAGQDGIPTAFIVDGDGKIAWIGHPTAMDKPLEKIHAGKWDLKAAAAEFAEARKDKGERQTPRVPETEKAAVQAVQDLGGKVGQGGEGGSVAIVDLGGTQVTDAELKKLKELKKLQFLRLVDCKEVTDAGLKEIKEFKELQTLFIGGTPVTDAGLKEIKDLKELRQLGLGRTRVTDAGMKELKELKKLQQLFLFQTKVTDEGLKELKELKELRQLYLDETKVTDAGVEDLQKALPQLKVIPPRLKGEVKSINFDSKALGTTREVKVYLPPGHDRKKSYPVLYAADGFDSVACELIEPLILSGKLPPLIVVGTAHGPGQMRQLEYLSGWSPKHFEAHEKFFCDEVIPWAEREWGASQKRSERAVYGCSNSGPFALIMANRHSELFGHVFAMMVYGLRLDEFESGLKVDAKEPTRYVLVAGEKDKHGVEENQKVEEVLKKKKLPVSSSVIKGGGHTHELAQEQLPRCIEAAFGKKK